MRTGMAWDRQRETIANKKKIKCGPIEICHRHYHHQQQFRFFSPLLPVLSPCSTSVSALSLSLFVKFKVALWNSWHEYGNNGPTICTKNWITHILLSASLIFYGAPHFLSAHPPAHHRSASLAATEVAVSLKSTLECRCARVNRNCGKCVSFCSIAHQTRQRRKKKPKSACNNRPENEQ